MTRFVVAPDSFKGTMSAATVAGAVAAGLRAAGAVAVTCPLADGGEGTVAVLAHTLGGELVEVPVTGPLGARMTGTFLLTDAGRTAVVETATASGLALLAPGGLDAEAATSRGTGELVAAAVDAGVERILLGVGGSACTDGGDGAVAAIAEAGGLRGARLTVLCDVRTPFEEAARVYGPQKGADTAAVERLTRRLHRIAGTLDRDPRGVPGSGAAGGLAGGLWARFGAALTPGIEAVLDVVGFDSLLAEADAVVTGEGRLDGQTAEGKVVSGVAARATARGRPVHAVVGRCAATGAQIRALGLAGVLEAGDPAALAGAGASIAAAMSAGRP